KATVLVRIGTSRGRQAIAGLLAFSVTNVTLNKMRGKRSRPRKPRGRPREGQKREVLLARALQYVLVHGLEDLSLRPLASALGTSARMLVYHFGSREDLLRALVMRLRRQEDARIRDWWKEGGRKRSLPDFVRWYWGRLSSRYATPAGRLLFEI